MPLPRKGSIHHIAAEVQTVRWDAVLLKYPAELPTHYKAYLSERPEDGSLDALFDDAE